MVETRTSDTSLRGIVKARFGITPDHVVGLRVDIGWVLSDELPLDCPDCEVPLTLALHDGGSVADGVVVCGSCGSAEAISTLSHTNRRAIRAAFVARREPTVEHPQYQPSGKSAPSELLSLEAELKGELSGRRLVCEISLTEDRQAIVNEAFTVVRDARVADDATTLARRYPALTACFLVAAATHGYAAGNLYDNLPVNGLHGPTLGQAFERSLDELRLERFDAMVEGGAMRYVARILGHAGIPAYCCDDYFGLVLDETGRGVDDATELISRLRLAPSRLNGVDKPVGRFLLHGGPVARDFLDRTIEMLGDWSGESLGEPAKYGLPLYLYEALSAFDRTPQSARRAGPGQVPRPTMSIDPWDPSGPFVSLPPVPPRLGSGTWRISSGDRIIELQTSNLELRTVSLPKSLTWTVDLMIRGTSIRRAQFVGLGALNALMFDAAGSMLRDPTRVTATSVAVLLPPDATIHAESADGTRSAARLIEEYPAPTGDWSGFSFGLIDVAGLRRLVIDLRDASRSCWISEPAPAPVLSGEPIEATTTIDGLPVWSGVPAVSLPPGFDASLWRGWVTVNGDRRDLDLNTDTGDIPLTQFVDPSMICDVELVARGPLGSDFAAHFVAIPELGVDRPRRVILPGTSRPSLSIRAAQRIAIEHQTPGEPYAEEARGLGDRATINLTDGTSTVELAVSLPVLLWALSTRERSTEPASETIRAGIVDVVDDNAPLLKVGCGVAGVQLGLEVECRGDILHRSPNITTTRDGRWVFDLSPAKDALRQATTTASLRLRVDGMPVAAAELRQDPGITEVEAELDSGSQLHVQWSESRAVIDRVIRCWPISRPWDGPLTVGVPDGSTSEWVVDTTNVANGAFLVEVAIDDGWSAPRRPQLGVSSTAHMVIGGTGLRSNAALDIVASAISTGRYARELTEDEIDNYASELLQALESELTIGPDQTTEAGFRQTSHHLASRPEALATALDGALSRGIETDTLLALGIELARHIESPNHAEASPSLWASAPALAVRLDLASDDAASSERIETYLGICDLDAWQFDATPTDDKNMRVLMSMKADQLRMLRVTLDAVPVHLLDPETRQLAAFEWAVSHQQGEFDAAEWVGEHRAMLERMPIPSWADDLMKSERVGESTAKVFPHARLPELVLRSSVLALTEEDPLPRRALQRLRPHAPLLVNRSLVLAMTVMARRRATP